MFATNRASASRPGAKRTRFIIASASAFFSRLTYASAPPSRSSHIRVCGRKNAAVALTRVSATLAASDAATMSAAIDRMLRPRFQQTYSSGGHTR